MNRTAMARIELLERQIRELAAALFPKRDQCDMGYCDGEATGLLWAEGAGWLPACAEHIREAQQ